MQFRHSNSKRVTWKDRHLLQEGGTHINNFNQKDLIHATSTGTSKAWDHSKAVCNSPQYCPWSRKHSCRWLSPWLEPQLSAVLACCCSQATLWCYSHSFPRKLALPILQPVSLCAIYSPIYELFSRKAALGSCSFISPIRFIERNGEGTGWGHRGNTKTALEMLGCEVVMTIGKLLCVLPLPPPLPPAEKDGVRVKMSNK